MININFDIYIRYMHDNKKVDIFYMLCAYISCVFFFILIWWFLNIKFKY